MASETSLPPDTPIDALDVSTRQVKLLKRADVTRLGELILCTTAGLLALCAARAADWTAIQQALRRRDLADVPRYTSQDARQVHMERAALVDQLLQLGVQAATPLMVHASLRRVGPIDGGADGLLDALAESMGADGTLVMVLGADEAAPFDPLRSPAHPDMGVLAEVFRRRKGTRVNDHAAARFGARGPLAGALLEPIPLHDYYGPGSVLARFTALGGSVLRLGADVDTVTLTHWAEYLARVPNKRRVQRRYVRADSGEQWIASLDDSEGIAEWPAGDYFAQVWLDFVRAGHARRSPVGNCTAELFAAQPFVAFAVAWLEAHL